jgi:hypothetical protein
VGLIIGGDKGISNKSPRVSFRAYPASVVCGAERIIPLYGGKAQGSPNLNGADERFRDIIKYTYFPLWSLWNSINCPLPTSSGSPSYTGLVE